MKRLTALVLCAGLALPAPATAQEPQLTPEPGVFEQLPQQDPVAGITEPGQAEGLVEESESISTRESAPNTDNCPHELTPPEPVSTSERVAPGQPTPTPLPAIDGVNCGLTAPEGYEVKDDILASAWIVADIDSGEVIAEKDPHGRYRPASIIKALLALVVIDELDLDKKVTATEESAAIVGSAVGLGAGGEYTIYQLLQGLLMASGNDAAHALAQELGGDEETLKKVNALAQSLGTTSTVAASYSGLDAPGMSTSAYDMALIYQAAYNNPVFADIVSTEFTDFPGYGELPGYELWNDNGLFMNDPDGIGGKTGYTDDANHTFVGAMDRDGRRLMAIVLDTTTDHGPRAWQQAQELLHEAYRFPAGSGVDQLENRPALEASSSAAATSTPASSAVPAPAQETSLQNLPSWTGWAVVGLVGALVVAVAGFSLSRRPGGRHHR